MDHVTDLVHRGNALTDHYTYDGLGQSTRHYNNVLGSSNVENAADVGMGHLPRVTHLGVKSLERGRVTFQLVGQKL